MTIDCIATSKHVINRYLMIDPDFKEDYLEFLVLQKHFNEASAVIYQIIKDSGFSYKSGKSPYYYYSELTNMICEHHYQIVPF